MKEAFLVHPTLTSLAQCKSKTFENDAIDLLGLSLVSVVVYIYCLGKKFYCTYLKTTELEMRLSNANLFTRKCGNNMPKYGKKEKKHASNFSTLSIDEIKTKEKYKSILLVYKYSTIAKTQQYLRHRSKGLQLSWKETPTQGFFSWNIRNF